MSRIARNVLRVPCEDKLQTPFFKAHLVMRKSMTLESEAMELMSQYGLPGQLHLPVKSVNYCTWRPRFSIYLLGSLICAFGISFCEQSGYLLLADARDKRRCELWT